MDKEKIVLIESMNILRSRLKQNLATAGFEVYEFDEGSKALKIKKLNPSIAQPGLLDLIKPDLIILSLDLEDIDGLKVLSALKSISDLKNTPIIVSSAHNDKETIIAAISAGAADYVLKKDAFVNTLIEKVQKIFESSKNTFKATLKREVDWVKYGNKELSFALIMVKRYATGKPINQESLDKVIVTLKSKLRHYDWIFPLSDTRVALILPVTTLKDVVILRNRLLELLKMLGDEMKLPMDVQIGFSHFPVNAKSPDELISLAEEQIQE